MSLLKTRDVRPDNSTRSADIGCIYHSGDQRSRRPVLLFTPEHKQWRGRDHRRCRQQNVKSTEPGRNHFSAGLGALHVGLDLRQVRVSFLNLLCLAKVNRSPRSPARWHHVRIRGSFSRLDAACDWAIDLLGSSSIAGRPNRPDRNNAQRLQRNFSANCRPVPISRVLAPNYCVLHLVGGSVGSLPPLPFTSARRLSKACFFESRDFCSSSERQ
jgi:hypothetical protein